MSRERNRSQVDETKELDIQEKSKRSERNVVVKYFSGKPTFEFEIGGSVVNFVNGIAEVPESIAEKLREANLVAEE